MNPGLSASMDTDLPCQSPLVFLPLLLSTLCQSLIRAWMYGTEEFMCLYQWCCSGNSPVSSHQVPIAALPLDGQRPLEQAAHLSFHFLRRSQSLSCVRLCDPMDCSLPGSSVHGILQARILEWVAFPFSRGPSPPRDQIQVSCIAGRFFTVRAKRR